jgi:tetratricopeptide (TPR) repeat protein
MRKISNKNNDKTRATTEKTGGSWSAPIYVYWFIILFFIAATFYILGRSHGMIHNPATLNEEVLMQATDYYNAGQEKLKNGDVEGAIADLTAVVNSGVVSGTAYIARGEAYLVMGDYKKAMADFKSAIEHDSTNVLAYYDKALLEMRIEDYNAAMIDLNNALVVAASSSAPVVPLRDIYAKRGQLNLWQKNWDGAIADYTNSLARPDGTVSPDVYAERAEAYTAKGNYADAITDYGSAMQVIKEQLTGVTDVAEGEKLSRDVMVYTEKSAALYLKMDNKAAALANLEGARQIAIALNDTESVSRLDQLIADLSASIAADEAAKGKVVTLDQVEMVSGTEAPAPAAEPAPVEQPVQ